MSLLESGMNRCVVVNQIKVSDGAGGIITRYEDGAEFDAAIVLDDSREMVIAQAERAVSNYKVYTRRNTQLKHDDIIKQLADADRGVDELILKITSDGTEKKTPKTAGLQISVSTAKKWVI